MVNQIWARKIYIHRVSYIVTTMIDSVSSFMKKRSYGIVSYCMSAVLAFLSMFYRGPDDMLSAYFLLLSSLFMVIFVVMFS